IRFSHAVSARPALAAYDPGRHEMPHDLARAYRENIDALTSVGFQVAADLYQQGWVKNVNLRAALLESADGDEKAVVAAMHAATGRPRVAVSYVEFVTKFADGRKLLVNNSPQMGVYAPVAGRTLAQFLDVRDPARLRRIHQSLVRRHVGPSQTMPADHRGDPAGFLSEAMVRELQEQVSTGYLWLDQDAGVFRPTLRGALLMTWKLLPPVSNLRKARLRYRANQILRELGMEGPDPDPVRSPSTGAGLGWAWVVVGAVVVVFLISLFGIDVINQGPDDTELVLSADFTVPDDF
ncbi:MAG: hypothetical protein GTN78_00290, partial [Gemmatimonadales bacterium]|nr:hypothetical protein [Gemmatimonadales bacterium]NIQ98631.1 hypothetical protein [Gemmatimonadales bacterium]